MFLNILIGLLTILLILIVYLLEIKRRYRSIAHIPGPERKFLIGNVLDLGTNPIELLENSENFMKKHGKYVQIWVGPTRPFLWISDVKFMEFILSSMKHIEKSKDYSFLHKWIGQGLLVSDGAKWKHRRKLITPAFHFKVLEQFIDVFNNTGDILIEKLSKEVNKDSVDIYPFITLYALDTICETAMGTSVNAQYNENSEYVWAVKKSLGVLIERTFSAWKQFDLPFMLSESYKDYAKAIKILHKFTNSVIKKRRQELHEEDLEAKSNNPEEKQDEKEFDILGIKKKMVFLDLLIKLSANTMTDADIREEVDTFMFEGHDTTASASSFALYEIARNPEIQQKIMDELTTIFADDKNRNVTYKDLMNMKYMELVIKETLRLYPTVPFFARELKEDINFDGTILPAGLTLTLYVYIMHRNPELYPDPEKFIPERFSQESTKDRSPYAFLPFSAGPRNCIGQKYAMLEMKATIAKVLKAFELSSVPDHKLVLSAEVVLKSANGICIRLRKRD